MSPSNAPSSAETRAQRPVTAHPDRYSKGCRCSSCRAANRRRVASWRARRRGKQPPEHGENGYVNWGCRCALCRAAHTEARRASR